MFVSPSSTRHFSAERLKEAQAQSGLTNDALADKVGVDARLLGKWRAGTVSPSGGNVIGLSIALAVPAESFYVELEEAA